MRRFSIVLFFLLAGAAAWGWYSFRKPPPPLEMSEPVRIHQGVIIGGRDRDNPDILQFNGLPYASARRWSPPSAPPQWGAISRDARNFGPECLQNRGRAARFIDGILEGSGNSWFERLAARTILSLQPTPPEAEDCLFLNIRTANLGGRELQPVMVWLHGGAHQYGSGSQAIYQSNGLVEQGVLLVTLNYRLGPFGYLAHPALTEEAGTSGNYGLLDQIAALGWIQDNIAVFGGDPGNVTVFGESAGAQSITELMASPLSEGLFHKAILQSGASTYNALHLRRSLIPGVRSAEEAGADFLSSLAPPAAKASDLRAIPAQAILSRMEARPDLSNYFLPVVDGRVLPRPIGAAFRDGQVPHVPMIAGYNADEGTIFYDMVRSPTILSPGMTGTLAEREEALASVFGLNPAKALQALYGMNTEETWDRGAVDMLGDDLFGVHMRFVGRRNAAAGAPTFLYHFTRVPPSPNQTIGAFHAAEIPFVFGSHPRGLRTTPADDDLTRAIIAYWTNFARTGDPNGTGVPEWPAYQPDRDVWLDLNHSIRVIEGLRARKLDILEETLLQRITVLAGPPVVPALPEPVPASQPAAPPPAEPAAAASQPAPEPVLMRTPEPVSAPAAPPAPEVRTPEPATASEPPAPEPVSTDPDPTADPLSDGE